MNSSSNLWQTPPMLQSIPRMKTRPTFADNNGESVEEDTLAAGDNPNEIKSHFGK